MLKLAASGIELQFFVRRERDGRFLAVRIDAGAESTVVNAPTLKDLHARLADIVALKYGPNVRIRLLVWRHTVAGPRVGPKQARFIPTRQSDVVTDKNDHSRNTACRAG
jgi:hypothetical protein